MLIARALFRSPVLVALLFGTVWPASAAGPPDDGRLKRQSLSEIETLIRREVAEGSIPGAVVLVERRGRTVFLEAFGWRDVANRVPMTTDTIFQIYSMTKPITSVAALMLIDDGKLRLDDPVAKYLPAFADVKVAVERKTEKDELAVEYRALERPMTIEDLLRHSSGITTGSYPDTFVRKAYAAAGLYAGDFDNAELAARVARLPLSEQPATVWNYGLSTDILGRVIEVVSGMSLLEFEKKRLFDPLGMTETSYRVLDPATQQRLAELLPGENFGGAFPRNPRLPRRWESGAGGLASTVFDYARFCRMILGGGELDGRRYLRPGTFGAMVSDRLPPHVLPGDHYFPGDGFGFGLGFAVRISRGQHNAPGAIGELKWDGALGTYFWIDPKEDMFVILMMQTTKHAERIKPLLKKAVYDAFGK